MASILNHALADRHAGNPNLIVDGDFRFWFEGTSQTTSGYGSATMWQNNHRSTVTKTHSRQAFPLGQTDVPGNPTYFSRTEFAEPATPAANDYCLKAHSIEGVDTLAGKQATLSFWAKSDAARNIATEFTQSFGSGGTPSSTISALGVTTFNLTTSWQKFTTTVSIPSISGKTLGTDGNDRLQVLFWFLSGADYDSRNNALGPQSGTVDIARVKLEEGSVATEGGGRNEAEELALVQRYFQTWTLGIQASGHAQPTYLNEMRSIPTCTNNAGWVINSVTPYSLFINRDSGTFGGTITLDARL